MANAPHIGRFGLEATSLDDRDARGVIWTWEDPKPGATYVIGVDPTVGLTGWHRELRKDDDVKVDNGAIEVLRVGFRGAPDVQVAEYAGPIDPFELAAPINYLGRYYGQYTEEEEALVIIEVAPGPGLPTQRELINRFGYTNFFVWRYLDSLVPMENRIPKLGWYASNQSVRDLWVRGLRHIKKTMVVVNSPWLTEEMADCQSNGKGGYEAYGESAHDDRVRAMLLALWAAHDWSSTIEPSEPKEIEKPNEPAWQASDISHEDMMNAWDDRMSELLD